jgi:hypothetical protein
MRLRRTGHILGAASVEIAPGGSTIVFSGGDNNGTGPLTSQQG